MREHSGLVTGSPSVSEPMEKNHNTTMTSGSLSCVFFMLVTCVVVICVCDDLCGCYLSVI